MDISKIGESGKRHVLSTELPAETIAVGYFDEREDPTTTTKRPVKPTNRTDSLALAFDR